MKMCLAQVLFMPTFMLLSAEIVNLHHQLSVMSDVPTMKLRYRSEPGYTSLAWRPKDSKFMAAIYGKVGNAQDEMKFNAHAVVLLDINTKELVVIVHNKEYIWDQREWIYIDAYWYMLTKLLWSPDGKYLAINSGWGRGEPTIFQCDISPKTGKPSFSLERVIDTGMKPQYNFVPQFWLRKKLQWRVHYEWISVYGLSGDGFEYQPGQGWVQHREPFMQYEQKLTTMQYIVCNDQHIFAWVHSLPKAQIAFDFLMITAQKGDEVAKHNLCGGILCADITYAKGFYILAYIPQSNPKEVRIQRMDRYGQLIGSPYILKNDIAVTCVWRQGSQELIVGEMKDALPKITWYQYDVDRGSMVKKFSRTIAEPVKSLIVKLLPNYDGLFFVVYFNDTSFDIYDMPDQMLD